MSLHRLENPERLRRRFAALEPIEKQALRYVFSQGGSTGEKELLDRFPEAAAAIEKLLHEGLLKEATRDATDISDSRSLEASRDYLPYVSLTPAEKSTLGYLLAQQPETYVAAASLLPDGSQMTKPLWIRALKKKWLSLETLRAFLETLPEPEKKLWHAARSAEGVLDIQAVQQMGFPKVSFQAGQLTSSDPQHRLYLEGLLFPNKLPNPASLLAPTDVLALIQNKTESKKVFTATPHAPTQLLSWGLRLLSDLQLFSAYQKSGRLQFTQNHLPLRHQLRAFLKAIGVAEENYGLFLNTSLNAFFAKAAPSATFSFEDNPAESMSRLTANWRDGETWQESAHGRDTNRNREGQLDNSLKAKRLILLRLLDDLPTRQWISYEDFSKHIFIKGWKRVENSYHADSPTGRIDRWPRAVFVPDLAPTDTLAAMVQECLVWLGLVDVGLRQKGRKSELTHIRLTAWGRQYLDMKTGRLEPIAPVPAESQFRVLANLEITASPRLCPDLLAKLFQVAVLRGVRSFELTKESLRDALDHGMSVTEILEFLQSHSQTPISPAVRQFIEEVAEKHGHIKLGFAGAYLEVDDPLLLMELRNKPALKEIFHKPVGDRLILLTDKDLERLAKVLRKMGYFPVVEKPDNAFDPEALW